MTDTRDGGDALPLGRRSGGILALLLMAVPAVASADMIWPALILERYVLTWWAIAIGLAAEWPVIRHLTRTGWVKAFGIDVLANLASTVLGIVLIPLLGVVWEIFPGLIVYPWFNIGTFNPGTWTATVILAAVANAVVEWLVLRFAFKAKLGRRGFALLTAANFVSVGVAVASLRIWPPDYG